MFCRKGDILISGSVGELEYKSQGVGNLGFNGTANGVKLTLRGAGQANISATGMSLSNENEHMTPRSNNIYKLLMDKLVKTLNSELLSGTTNDKCVNFKKQYFRALAWSAKCFKSPAYSLDSIHAIFKNIMCLELQKFEARIDWFLLKHTLHTGIRISFYNPQLYVHSHS